MGVARETTRDGDSSTRRAVLGYSALLAFVAGFVNAVALLILAVPVANLTAITTQLGMNTANPWLYEGHVLAGIVIGFGGGAVAAGVILGSDKHPRRSHHATVLTLEAALLLAAVVVAETAVKGLIGIEGPVLQALLAAAALGMQNGLTSSFRGMPIRTTHFTGTVTDLGMMLGRSRQHGIDRWKATILATTLLLFLAGGTVGVLVGSSLDGYALVVPAAICLAIAIAYVLRSVRANKRVPAVEQFTAELAPATA
ncbi:hypothetical protein A5634_02020 [Mycobacterium asiaticum]|uniref:DUF1275 family protein n=1 Tax=Mycobacterium asiaticum TaxID=1790 RepID=A0A1A3NSX5_MYCAS|nr:DUF1275 family protein [Mycobacterium asiaticum]OBK25128.1 hypothetical protein A5634_02020 [Mycobacterium asiaticum]